ncbi:proline-rich protein HaeIII subfamily 1-like [Pecten maximus]|uniref:proline-rich protein HaeIII subfamily 1-like n=1 Tax=Pecten maximus TaxID=6579 RepID=UPI001458D819|nr:proline-rich protein HaeIII subfamily 1-like [Pecten maximus]
MSQGSPAHSPSNPYPAPNEPTKSYATSKTLPLQRTKTPQTAAQHRDQGSLLPAPTTAPRGTIPYRAIAGPRQSPPDAASDPHNKPPYPRANSHETRPSAGPIPPQPPRNRPHHSHKPTRFPHRLRSQPHPSQKKHQPRPIHARRDHNTDT